MEIHASLGYYEFHKDPDYVHSQLLCSWPQPQHVPDTQHNKADYNLLLNPAAETVGTVEAQ